MFSAGGGMRIYRTRQGLVVQDGEDLFLSTKEPFDALVTRDDLEAYLDTNARTWPRVDASALANLRPPIGTQEVWGAGVTYYRSRVARMEEAKDGGNFYDRVYDADRPELFFKATPHRVVGANQKVAIRSDASWSVPNQNWHC